MFRAMVVRIDEEEERGTSVAVVLEEGAVPHVGTLLSMDNNVAGRPQLSARLLRSRYYGRQVSPHAHLLLEGIRRTDIRLGAHLTLAPHSSSSDRP